MDTRVRAFDLSRELREIAGGGLPQWLQGTVIACVANLELYLEEPDRWTAVAMHGLFAQAETLIQVCEVYQTTFKKRDIA